MNLYRTVHCLPAWVRSLGCVAALILAAEAIEPVGVGTAIAQEISSNSPVRAELEKTDRALDRGSEYLSANSCARGAPLLQRAREMQSRARASLSSGGQRPTRLALELTRRARVLVNDAIRACPADARAVDSVRDLFTGAEDLAQRVESEVRESKDPEANRYLDAARSQLLRAREAYRRQDFRQAVRWLGVSRNLYQRALREVRGPLPGVEHVRGALERCELLLSEVRLGLAEAPDAEATALLGQAERSRDQARRLFDDGRPLLALRSIAAARSSALEAHWRVGRTVDADQVRHAIEIVRQSLDEFEHQPSTATAEFARAAREKLGEAEDALSAGDRERASLLVRTADSLVRRLAESPDAP